MRLLRPLACTCWLGIDVTEQPLQDAANRAKEGSDQNGVSLMVRVLRLVEDQCLQS